MTASQVGTGVQGTVYLLHFSRPLHHAQHYLGWTRDLFERGSAHQAGRGSPLVRAAIAAGIQVEVVRTWDGDRHLERQLKNRKNARRLCLVCRGERGA